MSVLRIGGLPASCQACRDRRSGRAGKQPKADYPQAARLAGTVDPDARKQPKADYPQAARLAGTVDQDARKQPKADYPQAARLAGTVDPDALENSRRRTTRKLPGSPGP